MSSPRDPHLAEALRHAPDHGAAPPPALSAAILRAAREAVQPRAAPRWLRWLAALQQPRWAGSAAALMLGVLIGSLWWGRPETDPSPQERGLLPPPADTAAVQAPAPAARPALPEAPERQITARPEAAQPAPPAEAAAARERRAQAQREPSAPRPTAAPQILQDAAPAPLAKNGAQRFEEAAPAHAPAPAAAPPAAPLASAAMPPALARLAVPAAARDARASTALRRQAPSSADLPLSATSPLREWLLQLREASAGRWVRMPEGAQPGGAVQWHAEWREAGVLQARLSLHARTLWWEEADGSRWSADLDPAAAAALPAPP